MSNYKPLYDSIWSDVDFQEYTVSKKLLYIYLITNKFTEKSGIYKITVRQMSFDTGIEKDLINDLINEFINDGKLKYDAKNGIMFVKNIYKFHKGLIKNKNILLLTLKRSYELINTDFWQDLFDLYPNDETLKIFINEVINGSLMAHQLYINTSKNKGKSKSSNKSKAADNHNKEESAFFLKLKNLGVDAETWNGFINTRTLKKKPMTEDALTLVMNKLAKFEEIKIGFAKLSLENAIENSWTTIWEPKSDSTQKQLKTTPASQNDDQRAKLKAFYAEQEQN